MGKALAGEAGGHNARAPDPEIGLEGLSDPEVLEPAVAEDRVPVTANVRGFVPLLGKWDGEGCSHAGAILVPKSVRNEGFGVLVPGVEKMLAGDTHRAPEGPGTPHGSGYGKPPA